MHLLGTIFSGGWIHIWCPVSIWGSRTVCVGLSQNKLQCVCVHGDEGMNFVSFKLYLVCVCVSCWCLHWWWRQVKIRCCCRRSPRGWRTWWEKQQHDQSISPSWRLITDYWKWIWRLCLLTADPAPEERTHWGVRTLDSDGQASWD